MNCSDLQIADENGVRAVVCAYAELYRSKG